MEVVLNPKPQKGVAYASISKNVKANIVKVEEADFIHTLIDAKGYKFPMYAWEVTGAVCKVCGKAMKRETDGGVWFTCEECGFYFNPESFEEQLDH